MSATHSSDQSPIESTNSSLLLLLHEVEDPRMERAKKHSLPDILFLALCGVICGCESFNDIEDFGKAKFDWLKNFIKLANGIPSHDTINRVFQILSPRTFQECLIRWTQNIREKIGGEVVAIDGKAQRRARNKNENLQYIVNAWAGENRLLLGQIKVGEKSNEITAIPELLRILELSGCIITTDAMGCQKNIAKEIIAADADYVLALKANHETAHDEIRGYLDDLVEEKRKARERPETMPEAAKQLKSHSVMEKDHGRTTTWHYHQSDQIDWFEDREEWEDLRSVGMVETITEIKGVITRETRYYLNSLSLGVETFAKAVRGHWGVENQCHWVLDVIYREDESRARTGHNAENLCTTRALALNLTRQEKTNKRGIKGRVKRAGWDNAYLEKILGI